ncbi:hypothetical protein JHK85_050869 [Glycine max]|nr:hypothetical protein JHK85_050869 [Glycine max]
MVFSTSCNAKLRGRSRLMFNCQIRKQKPQRKEQNGHFLELSRPKLAQMAESDSLDNNSEGSTDDEVALMSKNFKQMIKKKGKFQRSSR